MNRSLTTVLSSGSVFVLLLVVWSVGAHLKHPGWQVDESGEIARDFDDHPIPAGPVLLPGPVAVVEELYDLFDKSKFLNDILQSLKRIGIGLLASAVPAFVLGIWFGVNRIVREAATPLFAFIQYIPPVAFVPILILWFGIGLLQQSALLFIGTFFYLTIMVAETVAAVPQAYLDAALTLGCKRRQLVRFVLVPFSLPSFIQHLRVIVGIAWTYLTVVEMVSAQNGIGSVIINSQRYLQTGRVMAGLVTIGALGVLCDLLLRGLARLLCRWKY